MFIAARIVTFRESRSYITLVSLAQNLHIATVKVYWMFVYVPTCMSNERIICIVLVYEFVLLFISTKSDVFCVFRSVEVSTIHPFTNACTLTDFMLEHITRKTDNPNDKERKMHAKNVLADRRTDGQTDRRTAGRENMKAVEIQTIDRMLKQKERLT